LTASPPETVTSRRHPWAARLRDARDGADKSVLFIEGVRLVQEAAASFPLRHLFATPKALASAAGDWIHARAGEGVPLLLLEDDVMSFVSGLDSPPGLVALAARPRHELDAVLAAGGAPLLVVLDGVQLPNNAGAVVRVAEAAGARAVIATAGGTDLYGPKALRASAGSAFRLPLLGAESGPALAERLAAAGVSCVAADPRGDREYTDWDWTKPTAVFLGAESSSWRPLSGEGTRSLRIPMRGSVESLNVSVAAGILLYEASRQRGLRPVSAQGKATAAGERSVSTKGTKPVVRSAPLRRKGAKPPE
jgi:TrmH family RNA methyltransferase